MKILFVTVSGIAYPSSRLRVFNYLPYLEGQHSCSVVELGSEWVYKKDVERTYRNNRSLFQKLLNEANKLALRAIDRIHYFFRLVAIMWIKDEYDIIFLQKVLLPGKIVRSLKKKGKARIIFDFDDAIFLCKDTEKRRIDSLLGLVDSVILTGDYNKDYAQKFNANVHNLVTPVDTERYKPFDKPKNTKRTVIGWVGTPATTRYLKEVLPTLERIDNEYEVSFRFIGASAFQTTLADVEFIAWEEDTEVRHIREFDIGIMPLAQEEYVLGKSGFKILQYMAVGIPVIASPFGINNVIVGDGATGYFAKTEDDWVQKFRNLIEDTDLQRRMGQQGREKVLKLYSLERSAQEFKRILDEQMV